MKKGFMSELIIRNYNLKNKKIHHQWFSKSGFSNEKGALLADARGGGPLSLLNANNVPL